MPLRLVFVVALLLGLPGAGAAQDLRICVNEEMARNDTGRIAEELMAGVRRSLPSLRAQTTPLPWPRCLKLAELGEFDAVLVGSHSPERAKTLAYPLRADGSLDASKRMFNLGFVLVRRTGTPVSWNGERFLNLDGPIGVQRGYSVIEFLRERQLAFDDGITAVQIGLQKLLLGRVAGLLVNPFNLELDELPSELKGKIEVAGPLIQAKPYFLILSRAYAQANPEFARRLWAAVEQARGTPEFKRSYARRLDGLQDGLNLSP